MTKKEFEDNLRWRTGQYSVFNQDLFQYYTRSDMKDKYKSKVKNDIVYVSSTDRVGYFAVAPKIFRGKIKECDEGIEIVGRIVFPKEIYILDICIILYPCLIMIIQGHFFESIIPFCVILASFLIINGIQELCSLPFKKIYRGIIVFLENIGKLK